MEPTERRQQILESAIEVFASKGFHGTSIADILKRAEIARGTFYLYFKSKREIFATILDSALDTLDSLMVRIDLTAERSPADQLRDNVRRVVDYLLDQPLLARIIFVKSGSADPEMEQKLDDFYERALALVQRSLKLGQQIGLLRDFDTHMVACTIIGGLREIGCRHVTQLESEQQREKLVEGLLKLYLTGLARSPEVFGLSRPNPN